MTIGSGLIPDPPRTVGQTKSWHAGLALSLRRGTDLSEMRLRFGVRRRRVLRSRGDQLPQCTLAMLPLHLAGAGGRRTNRAEAQRAVPSDSEAGLESWRAHWAELPPCRGWLQVRDSVASAAAHCKRCKQLPGQNTEHCCSPYTGLGVTAPWSRSMFVHSQQYCPPRSYLLTSCSVKQLACSSVNRTEHDPAPV